MVPTFGLIGVSPGITRKGCACCWVSVSDLSFRQFVFGVFADRLGDLMAVVDAVAFHRLDERLADYLLGRGRVIHTTHQELAHELGTVREIITRLLNRFEAAGAVKLGRERIEVIDAIALRALATGVAR
jgi:CRP/FNR family transcriptional regulator, anaerobic regulatory protein